MSAIQNTIDDGVDSSVLFANMIHLHIDHVQLLPYELYISHSRIEYIH